MRYPRIIGHRGGGALAPENTLIGFHIARRMGCRGVEFDAMLTADGVPVLIHDETLERTTTGSGRVPALRADQFAQLDAGIKHHRAFAQTPPPTLQDALAACAALGLWANVEIKPATDADEATGIEVARVCATARCEMVLSSFSSVALRAAGDAVPELPRAWLVETVPADWREQIAELGALALHVAARSLELSLDALRAACNSGLPVASYTVNDRATAGRLFDTGVTAIFTDRLDLWAESEM